jgi:hypothetical protein
MSEPAKRIRNFGEIDDIAAATNRACPWEVMMSKMMSIWRNFHVRDGIYFRLRTATEIEDERFLIVRAKSFEDAGEVLVEMTRQEFASAIAEVITLAELNYVNEMFGLKPADTTMHRTDAT